MFARTDRRAGLWRDGAPDGGEAKIDGGRRSQNRVFQKIFSVPALRAGTAGPKIAVGRDEKVPKSGSVPK